LIFDNDLRAKTGADNEDAFELLQSVLGLPSVNFVFLFIQNSDLTIELIIKTNLENLSFFDKYNPKKEKNLYKISFSNDKTLEKLKKTIIEEVKEIEKKK